MVMLALTFNHSTDNTLHNTKLILCKHRMGFCNIRAGQPVPTFIGIVFFIFYNIAAVVRAGQTSVGFWLLSCTFIFQSEAVPGFTFLKSPNLHKPPVSRSTLFFCISIFYFLNNTYTKITTFI